MKLSEIEKACMLVNLDIVQHNFQQMMDKANANNLAFRPHVKTHQSSKIAQLMLDMGINKIAVSSVDMCLQFISYGFQDICIAIPFNLRETNRINAIPDTVKLTLCVESTDVVHYLQNHLTRQVNLYIKTDTGYHRTGIWHQDIERFQEIVNEIKSSELLNLSGLMVHNGQTYHSSSKQEIEAIHQNSVDALNYLRDQLDTNLVISLGDTPALSTISNLNGFEEMRPGNFAYYDYMQYALGACKLKDIAVSVLAPVIAKSPDRNEIVLHLGAVHLSKESIVFQNNNSYGVAISRIHKNKRTLLKQHVNIQKLSQEHAVIPLDRDSFNTVQHGDLIEVIPIHSCLTANLMMQNTVYVSF